MNPEAHFGREIWQAILAEFLLAASKDAIVMVEGGANVVGEKDMVEALMFGKDAVQQALAAQEQLTAETNKTQKRSYDKMAVPEATKAAVKEIAWEAIQKAYKIHDKVARYQALAEVKTLVTTHFKAKLGADYASQEKNLKGAIEDLKYDYMRSMVVEERVRIGGRGFDVVRPISIEVGPRPDVAAPSLRRFSDGCDRVGEARLDSEPSTEHEGPDLPVCVPGRECELGEPVAVEIPHLGQ